MQAVAKEKSLRERFITMEPTPRVERIRQIQLGQLASPSAAPSWFGIDDLRIATRVWKETEGDPEVVRRAKVFAAKVREMPIHIGPDDLVVGWRGKVAMGEGRLGEWGHMFGMMMEANLAGFGSSLSDEDMRELKEEFIPYWKARDYVIPIPPQMKKVGITELWSRPQLPHWTPNWEKLLEKGLLGIKKDAEERLAGLDLTRLEEIRKIPFLEGVIIGLKAAAEIGERHAARARELAEREVDAGRKAELLKIAEVCDWVPANPARTFHEALQSCEFIHLLLFWEGTDAAVEPGRVDQYLYPYYESDIKEGRITKGLAQELIDCWFLKYSGGHGGWVPKEAHVDLSKFDYGSRPGGGPSHHCHVGGLKADGSDATNELSYMFLEPYLHFPGMLAPSISVFVHSKTPDDLLIRACQVNSLGGSWPMFINADLLVENLLARAAADDGPPLSLGDARKHSSVVGCHEPMIAGRESGFGAAGVETIHRGHGYGAGLPGELLSLLKSREFESFEELKQAFEERYGGGPGIHDAATDLAEVMGLKPSVLASALTEDCIEKGIAREKGGARYNTRAGGSGPIFGSPDFANSLAAIKKLVFDEQKITMDELMKAVENNFEGYEDIRRMCLAAPKFGNDDDYVDELLVWITHLSAGRGKPKGTIYGGRKYLSLIPLAYSVSAGRRAGAFPSGRLAGESFSDGVSPTPGSDENGPTAVLKSVGKINNAEVGLGQALNIKLDPAAFGTRDGFKRFAALVRTFVDQKVDHVQFNVVSSDTLKAAQKEPEKYQELTVKVAGYNARFVRLYKEIQDSIIAKTEHQGF